MNETTLSAPPPLDPDCRFHRGDGPHCSCVDRCSRCGEARPICGDLFCYACHDPKTYPYGCIGLMTADREKCWPFAPPALVAEGAICPDCAEPPQPLCSASYGWIDPAETRWGMTRPCRAS